MGSTVVSLHDLRTIDCVINADTFGCLQPAEILSAPALSRFTRLFSRMRFLKLKIEFFASQYVTTGLSCVSQSYKSTVASKDVILRAPSCYFHNLQRGDGHTCGRSFDLASVAGLGDFIETDNLSTTLSLTNATPFDAGIHYCLVHTDVSQRDAPYQAPVQRVQIKYTFVVEFMSQRQTMDASAAELNP